MSHTSEDVLVAGMLVLCGCTASPRYAGSGSASSGYLQLAKAEHAASEARSAGEAIAEARCAREVSCNNVGSDKRYVSLEDCLTRVWTSWQGDLVDSECEVDGEQLGVCLTDIRVLECKVQLESLELLPSCAIDRLCAEQ